MICRNCGNEIRDDARFCPHCGAANAPGPAGGTPSYSSAAPAWEGPEGGGKKKKTGLIIGIAVAAVAAVALIAVMMSGLLSNPKKQVEAAFVKSAAAYTQAEKALNMPDVSQWQRDRSISQRFALELKNINSDLIGYDLSALEGLGLRMNTDYDGNNRWLAFDLGGYWGDEDLFTFRMAADDDEMYFYLPQFTGDTYYGVNTETLGHDLTEMTGDDSMDSVSFNMFDLMDLVLENIDQEKLEQDLAAANKALWKAAEVKKEGARTLDLNGTDTKTTAYRVILPQEALERYVDDMVAVMSALNYYDLYQEMFRSMGMPEEELEDFMSELESLDVYDELAGILKDALDEFGDLELEVCLSGGYVSAMLYEGELAGEDVSLALYLGGGGEYVDDLGMEFKVNSTEITLESTGDHGGKSGVYTDKTEIRIRQLGVNVVKITSDLRYEPKKSSDNFSWKLSIPGAGSLNMAGSLTAQTDHVMLDLDDVTLKVVGIEVCSLACEYYVDCHPGTAVIEDPKIITQMDQMELMMTALEVQSKAEAWAEEMEELFISRLPEELLRDMMY